MSEYFVTIEDEDGMLWSDIDNMFSGKDQAIKSAMTRELPKGYKRVLYRAEFVEELP